MKTASNPKVVGHREETLKDPQFLKQLRIQMLKFAVLQLKDNELAEDAVQEALIGALKNVDSFGRQSALKTWVFAILKNKITDLIRKARQTVNTTTLTDKDNGGDGNLDLQFDSRGMWQVNKRPTPWAQPMMSLENEDFWHVFDACLNGLPEDQARLFMMREFLELDSSEICEKMNITTSNLHVMLYRARLRLRDCLEKRWFDEGERP